MTENNEIASVQAGRTVSAYSSFQSDDLDTRKVVYTALSNPAQVADHLNEVIKLANIVIVPVELVNENTGAVEVAPRIALIDDKNKAYSGTSLGLKSSVDRLRSIFGEPSTWPAPLPVKVVEQKGSKPGYKFFTIELA